MFQNLITSAAAGLILWGAMPESLGAEAGVSLAVLEDWSNVFGGRRAEFHASVRVRESFEGRVGWSLAVGRRTIARGETPVTASPQNVGSIAIQFDVPQVKEGVVMPAVLSVSCYDPTSGVPAASLEKPLWIFPENPFTDRSEWLKRLQIHLFDPVGTTRQVLQKTAIPFTETRNVDSLSALEDGILVIGEDTPLEEHRSLPQLMIETAAKGIPVLCLAPANGQFPVPGMGPVPVPGMGPELAELGRGETDFPSPSRIALRRGDVIGELDKRLDARAWPPDGRVIASSLLVGGGRQRLGHRGLAIGDHGPVIAQVFQADLGWPWLEIGFSAKRGKLIVCGFGLMRKWNAGPTPRFLFARLLEYLDADELRSISVANGEDLK